jgi:choline dehydrogenase-like flavoprotein
MVLAQPTGKRFELLYVTEHLPNRASRVGLDGERDRFGVPRLGVSVAFSDLDVETVVGLHDAIAARLVESGTGRLHYNRDSMPAAVRDNLAHFNSGAHHLGTTRMASNPKWGVVDADGRVFSLDNLFVCGGSVFPTGGHANPTLTIVALALRLSDLLKRKVS